MSFYFKLVCFLIVCNSFGQSSDYDIYIELEDFNEIQNSFMENDTMVYQHFLLRSQKPIKKRIFINEDGSLITNISVERGNSTQLTLYYVNIKDNNSPVFVKKNDIKNILKYPVDFKGVEFNNVLKLLREASNIYVIESDSTKLYFLVKKVKLELEDIIKANKM